MQIRTLLEKNFKIKHNNSRANQQKLAGYWLIGPVYNMHNLKAKVSSKEILQVHSSSDLKSKEEEEPHTYCIRLKKLCIYVPDTYFCFVLLSSAYE